MSHENGGTDDDQGSNGQGDPDRGESADGQGQPSGGQSPEDQGQSADGQVPGNESEPAGGQAPNDQGQPAGGQTPPAGGQGQPAGGQAPPAGGQGQPSGGQPYDQRPPAPEGQPPGGQSSAGGHGRANGVRDQPPAGGGHGQPPVDDGRGQPHANGGRTQRGQPPAGNQVRTNGGYRQPREPEPHYDESVGDIFSIPTTQAELKTIITLYTVVGLGVGIAGLTMALLSNTPGSAAVSLAMAGGPLVGVVGGLRAADALIDERMELVYATAAVGCLVGNLLLVSLATLFTSLGMSGGTPFLDVVLVSLAGGIGSAVTAAGAVFTTIAFTGDPVPAGTAPPPGQGGNPGQP